MATTAATLFLLSLLFLVAHSTPVDNVAVQWNVLANRLHCQSSGLTIDPNIILAQLGLAQLHALHALRGGAAVEQEAAVAYASRTVVANYFTFEQDLSVDPLLARQLKALKLSRWGKKVAKQLGEAVAHSLLRKRILAREFSLETLKEALNKGGQNPSLGLYRYLNDTPAGRDAAFFIFHNVALAQTFIIPDPLRFISDHLSQLKPPKIPSQEWNREYEKVKDIGRIDYPGRTLEMNLTGSRGSCTRLNSTDCSSVSVMSAVARAVIPRDASLHETVEVFAKISVAIHDALVVLANLQFGFWFWRPQTAFREGDPDHERIPDWTPYSPTPPHAEYPSGTVALTAAGAGMLERILGEKIAPFRVLGGGVFAPWCGSVAGMVVGDSRRYESVAAVVRDAQLARMYAGAHFEVSVRDGADVGAVVAEYVERHWSDSVASGVRPDAAFLDVVGELPKRAAEWSPLMLEF